ncbi:MAG: peptidase papain [Deltaproteobacteria bacterium]|nr:peptidase papain [Deltaproteobacteria bacterium]
MEQKINNYAMGWLPDYPDFRDFTSDHDTIPSRLLALGQTRSVKAMLQQIGLSNKIESGFPNAIDLRQWCSPVEDQGNIGSCTAHAGVSIVEYFERRAFGNHLEASRLFLYKTTRNLLHYTGDTGAFLRSAMAALALFGVPPEEYWPHNPADFDKEPSGFCYALAGNYQAISYYRLDTPGIARDALLAAIEKNLAAGLPAMFGFTVYSSYTQSARTGKIPFPARNEKTVGGHAIAAVGYDDSVTIKNTGTGAAETKGALLVRNSWGTGWGMDGFGWLPYEYVLKGLAVDWWSLLKCEWIDTGVFRL